MPEIPIFHLQKLKSWAVPFTFCLLENSEINHKEREAVASRAA